MFNTISKQCLLCLRLVSCGVSLLQSGFIWDGVDLTVCVPHSCFLLLETLRMCVGGGVCFLHCKADALRVHILCGLLLLP